MSVLNIPANSLSAEVKSVMTEVQTERMRVSLRDRTARATAVAKLKTQAAVKNTSAVTKLFSINLAIHVTVRHAHR